MKLIAVSIDSSSAAAAVGSVHFVPDSALSRPSQPIFLPDFATEWQVSVMPAVRVSRLGRAISRKFAHRYYDAATAIAVVTPCGDMPFAPSDARALGFDSSVAPGRWLPLSEDAPFVVLQCGPVMTNVEVKDLADMAIADLSRCITIKTGDIIALDTGAIQMPALLDTALQATLDGEQVLNFRFK